VSPRARFTTIAMCLLSLATAVSLCRRPAATAHAATAGTPVYAANGDLLPPSDYREWIYLTSGIDMSYSPKAMDTPDHSMFDNVFVNPAAWRSFVATGTWPDKTVMVLEVRGAKTRGSINQRGHFQDTEIMGFEVHVKDEARFPGKWAFFDFDSPHKNGTLIPTGAPCYTCHAAHAAVDTTFVQFYPTLLPIAKAKGTLSAAFLKDEEVAGANNLRSSTDSMKLITLDNALPWFGSVLIRLVGWSGDTGKQIQMVAFKKIKLRLQVRRFRSQVNE